MSLAVMMRVWAAPTVRGSQKLLLLALADYANGAGVCWPGLAALAQRIGEEERHCRRLLRALEGQGLIARAVGGGRARPTLYAVLAGLDHAAQHQLRRRLAEGGADLTQGAGAPSALLENPDLEDRVLAAHGPRNPVPSVRVSAPRHGQNPGVEVRVSGGADGRNPDIRAPKGGHVGTERGTSGDAGEAASAAPPCAETAFFAQDNRQRTVREPDHTEGGGHDHAAHARTSPPAPHACGDGHDDHHPPTADPSAPLRPAPRFGTKNRFPRSFRASWAENMHEEERIIVQTPHGQAQEPAPRPTDADVAAPVGRPDAARPWASCPPLASGGHNEDARTDSPHAAHVVPPSAHRASPAAAAQAATTTPADLPRAGNPTPRPAAARPWASRPPWGGDGQNDDARPAGPRAAQGAPSEWARPAVEATGPQAAHVAPAHGTPRVSPAAAAQAAPADHVPSGLSAQGAISTQARPAPAVQAAPADQPPSRLSTLTQGASSTQARPAVEATGPQAAHIAPPSAPRVSPAAATQAAPEDHLPSGLSIPAHGVPSERARLVAATRAAQAAPSERIRPAVEAQRPQVAHAAPPSAHRASPAPATQAAPADQPPSGPSSLTQGTSSGRIRPAHGSAASGQAAQAAPADQPPSGPHTPAHGTPSTRARPAAAAPATPRDDAGAAPLTRQRSAAVAQFYAVFPQARLSAAQEDEITAGVADRHLGLWTRVVREWRDQRYNPHSTTKILHLFSKEERREAAERAREAGRDHGGGPAFSGGRTGDPSTWPLGERERRTLERIRAELAVRGV